MMFERFTTSARRAVELAQAEARGLNHAEIDAQHLLLGILAERYGTGARILNDLGLQLESARARIAQHASQPADAEALRTIGIDLDEVRRAVEAAFGPGALERRSTPGPHGQPRWHVPFSGDAKKALELSLREALRLRHNWIGTEHIVLGLTRLTAGEAARLLRDAGVDNATVIRRIRDEAISG